MNVLITGASGFLGSALARSLAEAGHRVDALIRPGSSLDRLGSAQDRITVNACAGDREIVEAVRELQPDAIVHTACAYGRRGETLLDLIDANVRLGVALLEGTEALNRPVTFINTGTALAASVSRYARSKQQFSDWGRQFAEDRAGALRFANVALQHMYGPGDSDSKFTSHVIRSCARNVPSLALTAGEQARDFIYIDDVLSAYSTLLEHRESFGRYEEIDIGSGDAPALRTFVETAHRLTASATRLDFGALPYRLNEAMDCRADTARMRSLGWQPRFDLERGIARTIQLESNS